MWYSLAGLEDSLRRGGGGYWWQIYIQTSADSRLQLQTANNSFRQQVRLGPQTVDMTSLNRQLTIDNLSCRQQKSSNQHYLTTDILDLSCREKKSVANSKNQQQIAKISGKQQKSVANSKNQWQIAKISSKQQKSVANSKNQWQIAKISGKQQKSVKTTDMSCRHQTSVTDSGHQRRTDKITEINQLFSIDRMCSGSGHFYGCGSYLDMFLMLSKIIFLKAFSTQIKHLMTLNIQR